MKKECPVCGEIVKGRSDKVFCSPGCKSAQQYESRIQNEKHFLRVDRQLKINRKILKKYNRNGKTTLRREVLQEGQKEKYLIVNWDGK